MFEATNCLLVDLINRKLGCESASVDPLVDAFLGMDIIEILVQNSKAFTVFFCRLNRRQAVFLVFKSIFLMFLQGATPG